MNGAFFLTAMQLGLAFLRAHVVCYSAHPTCSTPAVVAQELGSPHCSPSLCVPVQAWAAQAECTGHTSLSVKVTLCRWDQ